MAIRTGLGLVVRALARPTLGPVRAQKPEANGELLVSAGVNPNRSRKGKSGETARRSGRKAAR